MYGVNDILIRFQCQYINIIDGQARNEAAGFGGVLLRPLPRGIRDQHHLRQFALQRGPERGAGHAGERLAGVARLPHLHEHHLQYLQPGDLRGLRGHLLADLEPQAGNHGLPGVVHLPLVGAHRPQTTHPPVAPLLEPDCRCEDAGVDLLQRVRLSLGPRHARHGPDGVRDPLLHPGVPRGEKVRLAAVPPPGGPRAARHVLESHPRHAHLQRGAHGRHDGRLLHRHLLPLCRDCPRRLLRLPPAVGPENETDRDHRGSNAGLLPDRAADHLPPHLRLREHLPVHHRHFRLRKSEVLQELPVQVLRRLGTPDGRIWTAHRAHVHRQSRKPHQTLGLQQAFLQVRGATSLDDFASSSPGRRLPEPSLDQDHRRKLRHRCHLMDYPITGLFLRNYHAAACSPNRLQKGRPGGVQDLGVS